MLFEFREYTCLPGKRERWVKAMETQVVPYQTAKGVVVVGMFVSDHDPNLFYWIRRYDSDEVRTRINKDVYENEVWTKELMPIVEECLDRSKTKVIGMHPTAQSIIR